MAIKLPDGKVMRTLPEQVDKNMQDIASINNEVNVIKESITTAYKIQGSATVADLNANTPDAAMNGYVYNMTDAGSLINSDESTTSVQIGDNVVLVWNDGDYFWDRLSGVVDTSNLVTLDTDQEITGTKTFSSYLKIGTNAFINGNYGNFYIGFGTNNTKIAVDTSNFVAELNIIPWANNSFNLGTSSIAWKDLYISGNISDGTNSVTVAQISKTKLYLHTLTVSNITPRVCVVLNSNVALSGSVGSNLGPRMIVTAYLASNYVSLFKTPNGSLVQINSDLTLSIAVSSGETITADTITEL